MTDTNIANTQREIPLRELFGIAVIDGSASVHTFRIPDYMIDESKAEIYRHWREYHENFKVFRLNKMNKFSGFWINKKQKTATVLMSMTLSPRLKRYFKWRKEKKSRA